MKFLKPVLDFIKQYLPAAPVMAEIVWVPGELFFCQTIERPQGASDNEFLKTAELSLEEASPFPVDQLFWGVYALKGATKALLYAAPKERLTGFELNKAHHVFPSFFAALYLEVSEPCKRAVLCGHTLSLLHVETQQVPSDVFSARVEDLGAAFDYLRTHPHFSLEPGLWVVENAHRVGEDGLRFHLKHFKNSLDENPTEFTVASHVSSIFWNADIRTSAFKNTEHAARKMSQRLWRASRVVLSGFLILFLGELFYGVECGWLRYLKSKVTKQRPEVKLIEEHEQLYDRLERFASVELDPFAMLNVLNSARPSSLYFSQVHAHDIDLCSIRGFAESVDMVYQYVQNLNSNPEIASAEVEDIQNRQGKVSFVLEIKFAPTPNRWLQSPEAASQKEQPDTNSESSLEPINSIETLIPSTLIDPISLVPESLNAETLLNTPSISETAPAQPESQPQ